MRLRITYSKFGPLIYVGNLDLLTIWERAARRAGLPLTYSQGFHPQPKMQLAAPLPLGFSSRCEVLDMRLQEDLESSAVTERLRAALPTGLAIASVRAIDAAAPPAGSLLQAAEYEVTFTSAQDPNELRDRVGAILSATKLLRERRDKKYDLRLLIEDLRVLDGDGAVAASVWMRLTAQPGATGRPDEVVDALGYARESARIERIALIPSL